ncbi:winged helix-turn-helix domain-containing protein [Robiginitalea sediminis]|uniref:winged helix-turn-helix domain-containing protein n=1 Tax=Robiginitalea sediminis TaxID=1982593 RepID=UPI000B4BF45D|nr:winged helix-turn-helix domain-containing protein [Robiginitalea sediminis]
MEIKRTFLFAFLAVLTGLLWFMAIKYSPNRTDPKMVKVALREVGHHILLANKDTTSRVLPVRANPAQTFELSFERDVPIHPDTLVFHVKSSIARAGLSENYLVEVRDCDSEEVVYSYRIQEEKNQIVVPCGSRVLPESCYLINLSFIPLPRLLSWVTIFPIALLVFLALLIWELVSTVRFRNLDVTAGEPNCLTLGKFRFYPEQHTLVYQESQVNLSRKEGEVLAILADQVNQVVRREELSKRVWEDQGVVVGRSLDTYISKLRKHLKKDQTIQLTNVHGVGYKLVDQNKAK